MNTIFKCAAVLGVVAMLVGSGSATITVRGCFYDDDTCSTKASVGFVLGLCDSNIFEINFIKRKNKIFSPSCGRRLCTITCLPVLTPRRHYRFSLCINLHRPLLTPVNMYTISRINVSTRRCLELEKEKGKLWQISPSSTSSVNLSQPNSSWLRIVSLKLCSEFHSYLSRLDMSSTNSSLYPFKYTFDPIPISHADAQLGDFGGMRSNCSCWWRRCQM